MIKICKKRTDPFSQYSCKIATIDELETKWDAQIKRQKSPNWKIWKTQAVERVKNGQSIVYYGMLNGKPVCEATALFDKNAVQNSDGLVDAQTA